MMDAEQRQYLAELMAELDQGSREKTAWDHGMEQGREEGLAAVARALLADHFSPESISKYTGLTVEEVLALQ